MSARRRTVQAHHATGSDRLTPASSPTESGQRDEHPETHGELRHPRRSRVRRATQIHVPTTCEAASAAGFVRIGVHLNDLKTLATADVADIFSDNYLELGEIEFFAGWAALAAESATRATLEKVRELAVTSGRRWSQFG